MISRLSYNFVSSLQLCQSVQVF
ncbi:hypothetical protein MED222_06510 [Vibrio sp. MED222]|nr:hypothetical protein MED222_06510 [Vibrio sp. MED222]